MNKVEQARQTGLELLASLECRDVWAGTDESYRAAHELAEKLVNISAEDLKAMTADADVGEPSLLTVRGNVGVIDIQGPLISKGNFITRFFGLTDYPAVRNALAEAANNAEVTKVLLNIDSGGGHVTGVQETADMIGQVSKMKPVTSFTSGSMASAAYWLGVSGKKVHASADSEVGSIGVFAVHMERSEMLKDLGIKATVFRSGKFKNLANPYEPLTEEARKEMQTRLDAVYEGFVGHVSKSLGKPYETVDQKMAQGRVFTGAKGHEIGLVHKVSTLAQTLASLEKDDIDISSRFNKNPLHVPKGALNVTPEQLAALAAVGLKVDENNALVAMTDEEKAQAAQAAPQQPEKEQAPAINADVVALLKDQIKDLSAKVVELTVESRDAKAKVGAMEVTHAPLLKIAQDSVNRMRVALGGSAADLTAMEPASLVAEHERVLGEFIKKFPSGGVAAVAPETDKEEDKPAAADPHQAARLKAVKLSLKR